jgi:hypothetical protein
MTKPIPRRNRSDIPPLYQEWLRSGKPYYLPFLEGTKVRELWAEHGPAVIAEHIERWPGSRPVNWWRYDAPSWRDPTAETQTQFLLRHNLMEPEEQQRARRRASAH